MEYILQHPDQGNVNRIVLQKDNNSYSLHAYFTEETWDLHKFNEDEATVLAKLLNLKAVLAVRYFIAGKILYPKKSYRYLSIRSGDQGTIYSSWEESEAGATFFNTKSEAEAVLTTLETLGSLLTNFHVGCKVYSTDDYLD